jgi:hypothetical protein
MTWLSIADAEKQGIDVEPLDCEDDRLESRSPSMITKAGLASAAGLTTIVAAWAALPAVNARKSVIDLIQRCWFYWLTVVSG